MTAADTVAESDANEASVTSVDTGPDSVARAHAVVATLFFAVGILTYAATAAKLVEPDFLAGSAALSFGRLLPVSFAALLYGWLGLTAVAAAYYMVPRLVGSKLALGPIALVNLLIISGGIAAGSVAVAVAGQGEGGRYLELPMWSDAIVGLGFVIAAVVATATASRGRKGRLPVAAWYLVGALWWYAIGYVVGSVPIFKGLGASLQNWFSVSIVGGLAPAAAGLGIGYYLIGRIAGELHPRLGTLGFWSLAFTWAWTAPRYLQYGPANDWVETIPVIFAAGVLVGVVVVMADMAYSLRGRWHLARRSIPLTFFFAGMALFVLVPLQIFVQSFRSSSSVVHLTAWETGFEQLTILGAFSFFALAGTYHLLGVGKYWKRNFAGVHLLLAGTGLGLSLISRWVAGLQSGYTWIGGVNSQAYQNYGEGFRNTLDAVRGPDILQLVGLGVFVAALIPFFVGLVANAVGEPGDVEPAAQEPAVDAPTQRLGMIVQGAFAMVAIAAVVVFITPAVDAGSGPSILAEDSAARTRVEPQYQRGYELYVSEGCWYCHTQQVRAIVTDVGLGAVSTPGDYFDDDADVLGIERIGPDLSHAGNRAPTASQRLLRAYLTDPRNPPGDDVEDIRRPWSTMPSYGHLSEDDLRALAAYVSGLE